MATTLTAEGLSRPVAPARAPERPPAGAVDGAAYAELRRTVARAGLFARRYDYYARQLALCYALLAGAVAFALAAPPGAGWTLLAGAAIAFASVQIALAGHDAGHLAVFRRPRANWLLGQICWSLTVGVGFWYWYDRHNRHHAHTNDLDDDPDLAGRGLVAFTEQGVAARTGWRRTFARYQARFQKLGFFSPFLFVGILYLAFGFRLEGWQFALTKLRGARRAIEVAVLTANLVLWAALAAPLGWRGLALFVLGNALGSIYLALIIAPNHKGMPTWAHGAELTFLERQVLSSRNIRPGRLTDFVFGALNYQIEHHLFPTMPRVNYARARAIVRAFCAERGLPYEEVDVLTSYRMVYAELVRVSRSA
jgi:fatty acid desaturase